MEKLHMRTVLAQNLKAMMKSKKLRQDSFKAKTGIAQSSIGRYLTGEAAVTLDKLQDIADFLEIEPWHLLVPNLEPSNLPVVLKTEVEREFYRRMSAATELLVNNSNTNSGKNTVVPKPSKVDTPKSHEINVGIRERIKLGDEGESNEGTVKAS